MPGLEEGVVDAVANNNFKALAEGAAYYTNLAMADAQASASRRGQAADAAHSVVLKRIAEVDPVEALSLVKAMTGYDKQSQAHDLAGILSQLSAAVASIQAMAKTAQTTPPDTSK